MKCKHSVENSQDAAKSFLADGGCFLCLYSDLPVLRARILRLEETLGFYADPATYFAIGFFPDLPTGPFIDDFSETELGSKPGKMAREALKPGLEGG